MVDSHVLLSRIDKIRECAAKLRKLGSMDREAFLRDEAATELNDFDEFVAAILNLM